MSKHIGLNRAKQSDRQAKNDGKVLLVVKDIAEKVTRFGKEWMDKHNSLATLVSEWTEKHNKLGAVVEALFKNSTLEIGKIWGNEQAMQDSIEHMDLNILALAEMNKHILIKLLQKTSGQAGMTEEEIEAAAEELRKDLMKRSFSVVQERLAKERAAKEEAAEKAAREEAEAKTEAEKAEAALKAAEQPVTIEEVNSGGPGCDIPEGATVFGG